MRIHSPEGTYALSTKSLPVHISPSVFVPWEHVDGLLVRISTGISCNAGKLYRAIAPYLDTVVFDITGELPQGRINPLNPSQATQIRNELLEELQARVGEYCFDASAGPVVSARDFVRKVVREKAGEILEREDLQERQAS